MASVDNVLDLLNNERRRYALYYLNQHDCPVSVDELASQVADWQADPGSASIPEEAFDRIELKLQHVDLPKASNASYVQYDPETGMVELTGPPPEFTAIISIAQVIERPDRYP